MINVDRAVAISRPAALGPKREIENRMGSAIPATIRRGRGMTDNARHTGVSHGSAARRPPKKMIIVMLVPRLVPKL